MNRQQRGISTVELLVGVTVGLFIVGAALFFSVSLTRENRILLVEARLMQDMRSSMDLVTRELRRAGYWANATKGAWSFGASSLEVPYSSTGYSLITLAGGNPSTISYAYSKDTNDVADGSDQFGFRVVNNTLQMNVGGSTPNFQPITDPGITRITRFEISEINASNHTLTLSCPKACGGTSGSPCPTLKIREYQILLVGEAAAAGVENLSRTLRSNIRIRNDLPEGQCPT